MNRIKYFREKAGLLQEELAKKMNVDQSAVSLWETGITFPSTKNLIKLSIIFNCTIDELLHPMKNSS